MGNKIQEIRITPETARKALYELDGPFCSDEGMIIENALTLWEEERDQLDAAKQAIEILKSNYARLYDSYGERFNENESLQQQLKQAIEALEEIQRMSSEWKVYDAAKEALSLIREEANPHTAPASLGGFGRDEEKTKEV